MSEHNLIEKNINFGKMNLISIIKTNENTYDIILL